MSHCLLIILFATSSALFTPTFPRSFDVASPSQIVDNFTRARISPSPSATSLVSVTHPTLSIPSVPSNLPLEEVSHGLFDNLPLSTLPDSAINKVPLYNECKQRRSFPAALSSLTGYEILASILELSMAFCNGPTVTGGGAIIANVNKMDCMFVEVS